MLKKAILLSTIIIVCISCASTPKPTTKYPDAQKSVDQADIAIRDAVIELKLKREAQDAMQSVISFASGAKSRGEKVSSSITLGGEKMSPEEANKIMTETIDDLRSAIDKVYYLRIDLLFNLNNDIDETEVNKTKVELNEAVEELQNHFDYH